MRRGIRYPRTAIFKLAISGTAVFARKADEKGPAGGRGTVTATRPPPDPREGRVTFPARA